MKVEITDWAKSCLKEIHKHYSKEASQEKATEIVDKIVERALSLNLMPNRGRIDEELRFLNKQHRYISEHHYRIIYRVEGEIVFVTDIFSNWQDPASKLGRNK